MKKTTRIKKTRGSVLTELAILWEAHAVVAAKVLMKRRAEFRFRWDETGGTYRVTIYGRDVHDASLHADAVMRAAEDYDEKGKGRRAG